MSILYILLAILIFGVLVVVHEWGHFIAAKRSGIQVNEFWIGMGPCLLKKEWHGTMYCLRLLPFGGACVMEGEDAESEHEHAFARASVARRIIVVVAGAFMNFVLGVLIVLCITATRTGDAPFISATIESFESGFAYTGENGLQPGDEVITIDGYHIWNTVADFRTALSRSTDGTYDIVLKRDGKRVKLTDFALTADFTDEAGNPRYGVSFMAVPKTVATVCTQTVRTSCYYARMIWDSLGQLIRGRYGLKDLSGPVEITYVLADTAKTSMAQFWELVAFISINLGIMNLLPLPALDGGRLLFLLVEAVRGKPVPAKYEGYVHGVGLVLLLTLMVYIMGQDIFRLVERFL